MVIPESGQIENGTRSWQGSRKRGNGTRNSWIPARQRIVKCVIGSSQARDEKRSLGSIPLSHGRIVLLIIVCDTAGQIWEPGYESKSGMPQDGCHVDKFCGLPGTKVCVNSGGQVSSQMRKQNGLHRYRIFPSLRNSTIIHLTPPPTMATINDLPSEVLFMIMTYIRPLEPAPCPPPTTPRLWQQPPRPTIDLLPTSQHLGDFLCIYDAMRVCRRWRDIALETILYSTSPTIGDNWSLKEMIEVVKAIELDTAQNLCWWTREADVVKLPPNLLWRIVRSRLCVAKEG